MSEPRAPGVRAVTVDCWGTLLLDGPGSDDQRYQGRRLSGMQAILAGAGVTAGARELERAYRESGRRLGRLWRSRRDARVEQHVAWLLEALDAGLPGRLDAPTTAALVRAYASPALDAPPAADDGARAALDALAAQGIALALICNIMRTPGDVLRGVLQRAGLLDAFAVLTFSDECGIRKPDPEIFWLTLRQVGVEPEQAVHVGDDPILDVEGARDAGMGVIHLAPEGLAVAPVKPDAVITCLAELPAALARLVA